MDLTSEFQRLTGVEGHFGSSRRLSTRKSLPAGEQWICPCGGGQKLFKSSGLGRREAQQSRLKQLRRSDRPGEGFWAWFLWFLNVFEADHR